MYTADQKAGEGKLFFAKQPIFSKSQRVWGHTLLAKNAPWALQSALPPHVAISDIPGLDVKSYAFMPGHIGEKKMLVPFSEQAILSKQYKSLPLGQSVVEVKESENLSGEYLVALDQLKESGYRLAVDGYEGKMGSSPLLERADVVKISILGKTPRQILALMKSVPREDATLVATGVETFKLFNAARSLGFSYFLGGFFKKSEMVTDRKLSASQATRLQLFNIIETDTPDFQRLAEAISMDVSISYRLLLFLNSAAFSFPVEITSIDHAVVILGWEQMRNWLRMAILNDLAPPQKTMELMRMAAQRAHFFKRTAIRSSYNEIAPDQLFLLGLFSLMEPMLDMPIAELVEELPISDQLKAGLCGEVKTDRIWIKLAQRMEAGDWESTERIIKHLGLNPEAVAGSYYDSHVLTNTFFSVCA